MKKFGTVIMTLFVSVLTLGILLPVINKSSGGKVEEQFDKWLNVIPEKTPEPVPDTRENLVKIDLRNEVDNGEITSSVLFADFIKDNSSKNVFYEEYTNISGNEDKCEINKVYKDGGGLKLGTAYIRGYFLIEFNNYTYNRAKIIGKNYTSYSTSTKKYTSDESTIYVNEMTKSKTFTTNVEDKMKDSPTEECIFEFDMNYNYLNITSELGRSVIFQIELWTEGVGEELKLPNTILKDRNCSDFIYTQEDENYKYLVVTDDIAAIAENQKTLSIAFEDPDSAYFNENQDTKVSIAFDISSSLVVDGEINHFNGWTIFTFKDLPGTAYMLEIRIVDNISKEISYFGKDLFKDNTTAYNHVFIYNSDTILPSKYMRKNSLPTL